MATHGKHESVLLNESIDGLAVRADGIYVDGTFGRGGHSRAILERLSEHGQLIAFDRDTAAIAEAESLRDDPRFTIIHQPFSSMQDELAERDLLGHISGILLDLGVSSPQLDNPERGFSFMKDGPLDMRMDTTRGRSASEWLMSAELEEMVSVIKEFGEEKFGRRIAHAIVETREHTPITRTLQLAKLIDEAVPVKDKYKHPATRTFQAIRIFINSELDEINQALTQSLSCLAPTGRLAVISFHSLEDRLVKRFIREQSRGKSVPAGLPITEAELNATRTLQTIGKAIKPTSREVEHNNRARSSVLRVAEKL